MYAALHTAVREAVAAVVREEDMVGRQADPVPLAELENDRLLGDLPLSLLRFDDGSLRFVPATSATRRKEGAVDAIKLNTTGAANGSYMPLQEVSDKAVAWLPGLLAVDGKRGRHAGKLSLHGMDVKLYPERGSDLKSWIIEVGAVPQSAVELDVALSKLGLQWQTLKLSASGEAFRIKPNCDLPSKELSKAVRQNTGHFLGTGLATPVRAGVIAAIGLSDHSFCLELGRLAELITGLSRQAEMTEALAVALHTADRLREARKEHAEKTRAAAAASAAAATGGALTSPPGTIQTVNPLVLGREEVAAEAAVAKIAAALGDVFDGITRSTVRDATGESRGVLGAANALVTGMTQSGFRVNFTMWGALLRQKYEESVEQQRSSGVDAAPETAPAPAPSTANELTPRSKLLTEVLQQHKELMRQLSEDRGGNTRPRGLSFEEAGGSSSRDVVQDLESAAPRTFAELRPAGSEDLPLKDVIDRLNESLAGAGLVDALSRALGRADRDEAFPADHPSVLRGAARDWDSLRQAAPRVFSQFKSSPDDWLDAADRVFQVIRMAQLPAEQKKAEQASLKELKAFRTAPTTVPATDSRASRAANALILQPLGELDVVRAEAHATRGGSPEAEVRRLCQHERHGYNAWAGIFSNGLVVNKLEGAPSPPPLSLPVS